MTIHDLVENPEFIVLYVPGDGRKMKLVRPATDANTRRTFQKSSGYIRFRDLPHYALSHLWRIPDEQKSQHMWDEIGDYVDDEYGKPVAPILMRAEKRKTLLALLRARPGFWWIDVLCARVSTPLIIMGDIYKYCQGCYAMVDCLPEVLVGLSNEKQRQDMVYSYQTVNAEMDKQRKAALLSAFVEKWSEQLQYVYQLTQCGWWKRVWTWQEATLPHFTYLVCEAGGVACMNQLIPMQQLASFALNVGLYDPDIVAELQEETISKLRMTFTAFREIQAPRNNRLCIQASKSLSPYAFTEAVAAFGYSTRVCKNPVDYVYGVLGMLELDIPRADDHGEVWRYFLAELKDYIQWLLENGSHFEGAPQVASVYVCQKGYQVDLSTSRDMADVYGGLLDVRLGDSAFAGGGSNEPKYGASMLEVRNLPPLTTDYFVYKLFRRFGRMTCCRVITDQSDRRGTALVQYFEAAHEEDAIRCMNNEKYKGNTITVSPMSSEAKQQKRFSSSSFPASVCGISGASRSVLTADHSQDIDCTSLYIENLDRTVQDPYLSNCFCRYGQVIFVKVFQAPSKESNCGIVKFSTIMEAARALQATHQTRIKGKLVFLSFVDPKKLRAVLPPSSNNNSSAVETTERHRNGAYNPLLQENEHNLIAELSWFLENRRGTNFFQDVPFHALETLSSSDNVDLQRSAALAFAEITEKDLSHVGKMALDPIIFLLRSHDAEVQQAASIALGNLAAEKESRKLIVKLGVVERMKLQMGNTSVEMQCNAAACIVKLAIHDQSMAQVAESDAFHLLVDLANSEDPRVQRNSTTALLSITKLVMGRTPVSTPVRYLIAIMKATWIRVKRRAAAARALQDLALDEACARNIVHCKGPTTLLRFFESSNLSLRLHSVACIRNISMHGIDDPSIIQQGFTNALGDLLLYDENEEIHKHTIATLYNLAANSECAGRAFAKPYVMDTIRMLIHRFQPDVQIQVAAFIAILTLNNEHCLSTNTLCVFKQGNISALQLMLDIGMPQILISLMGSGKLIVQRDATFALRYMATDETFAQNIVYCEGLTPLSRLLKSSHLSLRLHSVACIHNISVHAITDSSIIQEAVVNPLIELLAYDENEEIHEHTIAALCNLAANSEHSRTAIVNPGVMEHIRKLIRHFRPDLQIQVAAFIAVLTLNNEHCRSTDILCLFKQRNISALQLIVDTDMLQELISLMESDKLAVQRDAIFALRYMATDETFARNIVHCKGLTTLLRLFKSSDLSLRLDSVACIGNIVMCGIDDPSIIQEDLANALVELPLYDKNEEIHEHTIATLCNLASGFAYAYKTTAKSGVVECIRKLIHRFRPDLQTQVAAFIASLTLDNERRMSIPSWRVFEQCNISALQLMLGTDMLQRLISFMRNDKLAAKRDATFALRYMAKDETFARNIVRCKGLTTLLRFFKSSDRSLRLHSVACIRNISVHAIDDPSIIQEDLPNALIELLSYDENEEIHEHTITTLCNLAANSEHSRAAIANPGVMDRFQPDVQIQVAAFIAVLTLNDEHCLSTNTLRMFIQGNITALDLTLDMDMPLKLISLMENDNLVVQRDAIFALRHMAINETFAQNIVRCKGLTTLSRHFKSSDRSLRLHSVACIRNISVHAIDDPSIIQEDLPNALIELLSYDENEEIHEHTITTLCNLAANSEHSRAAIANPGVMDRFQPDVQIQVAAFIAVLTLNDEHCLSTNTLRMFIQGNITALDLTLDMDMPLKLISLMENDNLVVQRDAIFALRHMAINETFAQNIVRCKGLTTLSRHFKSSDRSLRLHSVACIRNISVHAANDSFIIWEDLVNPLTELFSYDGNEEIRKHIIATLCNLPDSLKHSRITFANPGVVERNRKLIDRFRPDLQIQVAAFIAVLTLNDEHCLSNNTLRMFKQGNIPALQLMLGMDMLLKLISLMENDKLVVQRDAMFALRHLAIDKTFARNIVLCKGLRPLSQLLNSDDLSLRLHSVACIRNISVHAIDDPSIIQNHFANALVELLLYDEDEEINKHTIATLCNLAANSEHSRTAIVNPNVMERIRKLIHRFQPYVQIQVAAFIAFLTLNDERCLSTNTLHVFKQGNISALQLMLDIGMLWKLISLMENDKLAVQRDATFALRYMAIDKTCARSIVHWEGLTTLLRLFKSSDLSLRLHSVACIRNISVHAIDDPSIIQDGLENPLIVLLSYDEYEEIHNHAIITLCNLAANSKRSRTVIAKAGVMGRIRKLIHRFQPDLQVGITAAIANMVSDDTVKQWWLDIGVLRVLVPLLIENENLRVQFNVALVIGRLSSNVNDYSPFVRIWSSPVGGLRRFLTCFLHKSRDIKLQHIGVWTIEQLLKGNDPELVSKISRTSEIMDSIIRIARSSELVSRIAADEKDPVDYLDSDIVGLAKRVVNMLANTGSKQ